jgi:hypothetical protein
MMGSGLGYAPISLMPRPNRSPDLENGLAKFCKGLADSKITLVLQ